MIDLGEIVLCECPFCGGRVRVGLETGDESDYYRIVSYHGRPECEHGCPVGDFDAQTRILRDMEVNGAEDAAPFFRVRWREDVEYVRDHPACPRCGRPSTFAGGVGGLRLGCPRCGVWAEGSRTVVGLVDSWRGLAEGEHAA